MTLDILVENLGRVNYGHYKGRQLDQQRKGKDYKNLWEWSEPAKAILLRP